MAKYPPKHLVQRFFNNVIFSNRTFEVNEMRTSDYLVRYVLMNFILLFGNVILVLFIIHNIRVQSYTDAFICLCASIMGVIIFAVARTKIPQRIPVMVLMVMYALLCILLTWNGDAHGAGILFIFIYPLLSIILLGRKSGIIVSTILFLIILAEMFLPNSSKFDYHFDISSRIAAVYILVTSITLVFEQTRITKDRINAELNKKLAKQKEELKYFNNNLQEHVLNKTREVVELQRSVLKTVADLVECRDTVTGGHINRTQYWMRILLEGMLEHNVYYDEVKELNHELVLQSCQLHDVGKIATSDYILNKPGPLTQEEFDRMKEHVSFGVSLIKKIESETKKNEFLMYAEILTSSHHEKWDGTGYPKGIKGTEIPLLGRVMAIADVYDALVSERPYKTAFPHEKAIEIIYEGRGTQFDPLLVDLFVKVSERFMLGEDLVVIV